MGIYNNRHDFYVQPLSVESFCATIRETAMLNRLIITSDIPTIREARNVIAIFFYGK